MSELVPPSFVCRTRSDDCLGLSDPAAVVRRQLELDSVVVAVLEHAAESVAAAARSGSVGAPRIFVAAVVAKWALELGKAVWLELAGPP